MKKETPSKKLPTDHLKKPKMVYAEIAQNPHFIKNRSKLTKSMSWYERAQDIIHNIKYSLGDTKIGPLSPQLINAITQFPQFLQNQKNEAHHAQVEKEIHKKDQEILANMSPESRQKEMQSRKRSLKNNGQIIHTQEYQQELVLYNKRERIQKEQNSPVKEAEKMEPKAQKTQRKQQEQLNRGLKSDPYLKEKKSIAKQTALIASLTTKTSPKSKENTVITDTANQHLLRENFESTKPLHVHPSNHRRNHVSRGENRTRH